MDKNYFFDHNQTDRMYYANELSKADRGVAIVNRSPFLTLIDQNTIKRRDKEHTNDFRLKKTPLL